MGDNVNLIIKKRREELGLTLEDVAQIVGVNNSTVSRWESGDIDNMKRDKIAKLADALNISPAVIMGWEVPDPLEDALMIQKKVNEISKGEEDLLQCLRDMDKEARETFIEKIFEYARMHRKAKDILKEVKKEA